VRIGLIALCSLLAGIGVFHQPLWIVCLVVFLPMIAIALDVPNGLLARLGRGDAAPVAPSESAEAGPPAISAAQ